MSDDLPGKVYEWPHGLRELLDDERRTYIAEMWRRYQATQDKNGNAGDYILLAEICAAALSENDPAIAKEVVRILAKHNPSKAGRTSQREKEQILRLWDNFRKNNPSESYDSIEFREVISEIMGGDSRYSVERIRGIIRERDKKLEKEAELFPAKSISTCEYWAAQRLPTRCNVWPEPKVRAEKLGNISSMTISRWKKDGFPQPMKIRGRNYYSQEQLDHDIPAWLESKSQQTAAEQ